MPQRMYESLVSGSGFLPANGRLGMCPASGRQESGKVPWLRQAPAPCSSQEPTLGRNNQSRNMAALSDAEHPVTGGVQGEAGLEQRGRRGGLEAVGGGLADQRRCSEL